MITIIRVIILQTNINNPHNNIVNTNSLSATDISIECTNVRNTEDFQPLLLDSITGNSPNNFHSSEHIFVSNCVPTDSHLNLSIHDNIGSSTSHSTLQMITRSKVGIVKPNPKYALITNCHLDNDPKKLSGALNRLVWLNATHEELRALDENNTLVLVHERLI